MNAHPVPPTPEPAPSTHAHIVLDPWRFRLGTQGQLLWVVPGWTHVVGSVN